MYVCYLNDRKKLGFNCINDSYAVKQLVDFKNTLKSPVMSIMRKGKQTVIFVFSQKVLVAVFVFLKSSSIQSNLDCPSFPSSEISQYYISKSDNLEFLTSSSSILNSILKFKRGDNKWNIEDEEQEKLIRSVLARTPESDLDEFSINKFLQRILEIIDPVISNQKLWKILSVLEKVLKPRLNKNNISSTNILSLAQKVQNKDPKSKDSSSIFAETFSDSRQLSFMQKKVKLKISKKENNFLNKLDEFGLSQNHEKLSENAQFIEKLTRLRRRQPLYPSLVWGDSYQYRGKQLERKAPRHLKDYGIVIEGKTVEEMAMEYKNLVEVILSKSNLVIHENGKLNKQESTINIGDSESLGIIAFENNPLYKNHHFITSYPISEKRFEIFKKTGNIGNSPEERAQEINELQRERAQAEREKTTADSFYNSLPKDARIGNQQLREVKTIQELLKEDPNFSLTENQKDLVRRAKKYEQHKKEFYQNNPDIDIYEL